MKSADNKHVWLAGIVLALAVLVLPAPAFAQYGASGSYRTLTTSGEASNVVRPDVAYFPIDITTTAPIIDDAYGENGVKIDNTVKKLKELGIARETIKIMDPKLFRIDQYNASESPVFGISNVVLVTLTGIDKMKPGELRTKIFAVNQALSRVTITPYSTSPGSGQINNELSRTTGGSYAPYPTAVFGYSKYRDIQDQVLTEAIADARAQADHQAKILGVTIKDIIYFSQSYPYANNYGAYGSQENILPDGPLSSDPLNLKLTASVSVTYSFE
jgi:uncharacterized protein YggE